MPISRDDFAKKVTRALRKAGVAGELRYDAERFAIVSDKLGEFFLSSAHQLYTDASFWRRGGVLKHFARTMFSAPASALPKNFDEARANLVPVIRNAAYLDVAKLLSLTSPKRGKDDKKLEPRFDALTGTLCVGVACTQHGIKGGPHTTRHTFASHFLARVPDLFLLGKILGHSTSYVTELYGHLLPDHLERARNAVNFGARADRDEKQGPV